jgi:uncharacterized protein (DUF433 family)
LYCEPVSSPTADETWNLFFHEFLGNDSERYIEMNKHKKVETLGRYIVYDPEICHGKPTFRGTRIMVWQVLEMVAEGKTWDTIIEEWEGALSKEAITEALNELDSRKESAHA